MAALGGQVALVTGARRGIGRELALALADAGARSVIGVRQPGDAPDELEAIDLDLRDLGSIRAAIDELRPTILVNNAGIGTNHDALEATEEEWDEILDVNIKGAFRCARAAAALLQANEGMIVNVSSISGVLAPSTMSSLAYGTAKAALIHLTRGLAVAMAPKIRVNCVAPAFTDTPWMSQHFGAEYENVIANASAGYPLKRIAHPEDVAGAILGLITGGDFVTGQTLLVDGGLSLT